MSKLLQIYTLVLACFFSLHAVGQSVMDRTNKVPFEVTYSLRGGFYDEAIQVKLSSLPGAVILYTTNGDEPNSASAKRYSAPISIQENTVLRTVAIRGSERSVSFLESYFIGEPKGTFPIASLAIPPSVLFDPIDGMYRSGPRTIDSLYKKPGANFWTRIEVPAHIQLFEPSGNDWFNSRIGFRIFGGLSRLLPQKSFAIVARKQYGKKRIKEKVFGPDQPKKYKYLVFRNSGGDFGHTHFRDALMTSLVDDWDLEKQASTPSHVYINGEYWGIYNIREKVNRHFLQSHSEVDKDSLEIMEHNIERNYGSRKHYFGLLDYLKSHNLKDSVAFDSVATMMDVDNFMNYKIAQIYFDNKDAGGNIKFWRPATPDGKWRWILYDTDWGFGLHRSDAYKENSLAFHTAANGNSWPNPAWSTFILRKLLENEDFRNAFLNRYCDHLNSCFSEKVVLAKIDSFYNLYLPEMPRQLKRWRLSESKWKDEVQVLRDFALNRPAYCRQHLASFFKKEKAVEIQIETLEGGQVYLNQHLHLKPGVFKGFYFKNTLQQIEARPNFGHRFSHWEGIEGDAFNPILDLAIEKDIYKIKAIFEPYRHPLEGKLMINEISCNNNKTEDWIELYNDSDSTIQLHNWILADKKHAIRLPSFLIPPKDYAIICEDSAAFVKVYPNAYGVVGSFNFGLDKREENISLFRIMEPTSIQYITICNRWIPFLPWLYYCPVWTTAEKEIGS
ncbi:MAG: CotH kinase family protein [Saprospiraceae bacterium]